MSTVDNRPRFHGLHSYAWLPGRTYGVPPSMVARAMQCRLAGDWRGACAAARFEVRFDIDRVRRQYGRAAAAGLNDDLHHLVPDLVRWHAPRDDGRGLLAAGRTLVLADYGTASLAVRNPPGGDGTPQRMTLHLGTTRELYPGKDYARNSEDWTRARYLWDARETPGLLRRMGGGDRMPFFHRDGTPHEPDPDGRDLVSLVERVLTLQDLGQVVEAWQAAGISVAEDFAAEALRASRSSLPDGMAAMVPLFAPVAIAMLATGSGRDGVALSSPGPHSASGVRLTLHGDGLRAHYLPDDGRVRVAEIPRVLWQRMPDLDLLRTGQLQPTQLHPLVRGALFPEQADPGYRPRTPCESTVDNGHITLQCRGEQHRVAFPGGHITALDHTEQDAGRERTLRALGGHAAACIDAVDAWTGDRDARLPWEVRQVSEHVVAVVLHANPDELDRLLDAGIDVSRARDRYGRGALFFLGEFAEQDPAVASRLLHAAGLDINARDSSGWTALRQLRAQNAPPGLIAAMRAAGAVE